MNNLSTTYLGLPLSNPIIAGASRLSATVKDMQELEDAGVGAIVTPSLFEERVARANDYLETFCNEIRKAKDTLSVPIIASLNVNNSSLWPDFAEKLAEAGADAIELNFYYNPDSFFKGTEDIESEQVNAVGAVRLATGIPVSVKLSYFYTNVLQFVGRLKAAGASGFVFFNRMFVNDINIYEEEHTNPFNLSHEGDYKMPCRFIGQVYGKYEETSLAANMGFFTGRDVIKGLLSGADAVQVVSTLYRNRLTQVQRMKDEIDQWMQKHEYADIASFKGKIAAINLDDKTPYRRAQYLDTLSKDDADSSLS